MHKQDLTLATVKWSIRAAAISEFKTTLVIIDICLYCMEVYFYRTR